MTKQEAYEAIRRHFEAPDAELAGGRGMPCYFRDPVGRKCAVGCLIPDDLYDPEFDSGRMSLNDIVSEVWPEHHGDVELVRFLRAAQAAHDGALGVNDFLARLDTFAPDYGVDTGVEVAS